MNPDWNSSEGADEEDREVRHEAYRRLSAAVRRAGYSIDRLHEMLSQVATNEIETRDFLAREVYQVSDDLLDDLVRVRLADADAERPEKGGG